MSRGVIVHRWEETPGGATRIVESGVFDPDADDNPEWVSEALAAREAAVEEQPRLTPWEGDQLDAAQPAAVLESVGFGEDTALPEGAGEVEAADEEPDVDAEPQPASVIASVEFGAESDTPDDAEAPAETDEPKRTSRKKSTTDE